MKKIFLLLLGIICFTTSRSQEIQIQGNKFTVDNNEIWFNGINTPWHLFGDFGRQDFNASWWTNEFAKYKANHINLARVWIHASGEFSPTITETGYVSGATDLFWAHMDHLMDVSETNGVYVMPALLSFDITKEGYSTSAKWRKWIQSETNIQSYIDNVLIPMVKRYNNRPFLLAWEICNEPEWMFNNPEHGPQSFSDVQKMHAMLAAAIHENSTKFATTGSAAPKWNSPIYDTWGDTEGNMFSDAALSTSVGNPNAFLDFYQFHWYPWQSEYMASPFTQNTTEYGVDDRPVIVGESEGNNVCDAYICQTVSEMYESAFNNGFDGVCAWKTPQNDGHGTFENIATATNEFYANHPLLIFPGGSELIEVTGITTSPNTITLEEGQTELLHHEITPTNASDKKVVWTSSNNLVASVANGAITALLEGQTTITATTNDGNYTAACIVTVTKRSLICPNAVVISLSFSQNGAGEYCWFTTDDIAYINSWNTDLVEINDVSFTNSYSSSMPPKINGGYYIRYKANVPWSHFEATGITNKKASNLTGRNSELIKLYPNPFSNQLTLEINNTEEVLAIQIIDKLGRLVESLNINDLNERISLGNNLQKGIYLLRVTYKTHSQSFMINKQ